jgi:Na+-translocating ferredoxin:NAD+ oxidoreductase subunit G
VRVKRILRDALPLGGLAAAIAVLLAGVDTLTRARISTNELERTRQMLAEMIGQPEAAEALRGLDLGERLPPRFSICLDGGLQRVDFAVDQTAGYSGRIRYLVSLGPDARIRAVRVLGHSETPGLGDRIELGKSSWLLQFAGRRSDDPGWALATDGGDFDALSGATITSRAMVRGIGASASRLVADPTGACDHVVDG